MTDDQVLFTYRICEATEFIKTIKSFIEKTRAF